MTGLQPIVLGTFVDLWPGQAPVELSGLFAPLAAGTTASYLLSFHPIGVVPSGVVNLTTSEAAPVIRPDFGPPVAPGCDILIDLAAGGWIRASATIPTTVTVQCIVRPAPSVVKCGSCGVIGVVTGLDCAVCGTPHSSTKGERTDPSSMDG